MKADSLQIDSIKLIGIALPSKTTNKNNQSMKDCGELWTRFEKEGVFSKIPNKLSDEVLAVYHDYEGDHTQPFSYFIGCKVVEGTEIPDGLDSLTIPAGNYQKVKAKGEMPGCIAEKWQEIWKSDIARAYIADFELYDERSRDWNNAEVDIYLSKK
ncbi:MAG: GyrI-like domain-containing protein [Balneolaceae bacterium]|nr:GyrI-like domain-containing protein [Balneolaceae bacterium]